MKMLLAAILVCAALSGCGGFVCGPQGSLTYETALCHMLRGEPYYSDIPKTYEIRNKTTGETTIYEIRER